MKKRKLVTRIIACILALILILGLIVPVVTAAEITNEELDPLPDGFEYVSNGEGTTIIKSADNNKLAIQLSGYYAGFDTELVSVFIANLETKKTTIVPLNAPHYLGSVDLEDGYYVIFSGGYAWSGNDGMKYAIDTYQYVYIGDNFEYGKYLNVDFQQDDEIVSVCVNPYESGDLTIVEYNGSPAISSETIVFPLNAIPPMEENSVPNDTTPSQPTLPSENGNQEPTGDNEIGGFGIIWEAIKDSIVLIVIIAGCWVVLLIRKTRKENELAKQSENDKYDDKRIN